MKSFENSVNILVKAYLNDTLKHFRCGACAVGNLIAGTLNANIFDDGHSPDYVLPSGLIVGVPWLCFRSLQEDKLNVNDLLGYSDDEIDLIEEAFEQGDHDMFLSLMRVVDVLADIHHISLEAKEEAKALFVK